MWLLRNKMKREETSDTILRIALRWEQKKIIQLSPGEKWENECRESEET